MPVLLVLRHVLADALVACAEGDRGELEFGVLVRRIDAPLAPSPDLMRSFAFSSSGRLKKSRATARASRISSRETTEPTPVQ